MPGLNPTQSRAVTLDGGPALVIACAGSGKTRVLTERVAHLIQAGAQPQRILLLTFTRRAAQQMLERAADLHPDAKRVDGGTFHSFAMRMISSHYQDLHLPRRPLVIDEDDAKNAIGAVVEELNFDEKKARMPKKDALRKLISHAVNRNVPLTQAIEELYPKFSEQAEQIEAVRKGYARYKLSRGYVDFDDLLVLLDVLLRNPATAKRVQRRYDHVLVDEYQDTNYLQGRIALRLAGEHGNLMVVGDDAQSIYAFRGANVDNILSFPQQFPTCHHVTLEDNYRSSQAILDLGNAVLGSMESKFDKTMRAARGLPGQKPKLHVFEDPDEEAEWVADQIQAVLDTNESLSETAVLFRNAMQSFALEAELNGRKIPYVKFGGQRLNEAAHVRDVLSYLRVVNNPLDELAWMRALQLLPGIGTKTATKLFRAFTTPAGGGDGLLDTRQHNPFERALEVHRAIPAGSRYKDGLGGMLTTLREIVAAAEASPLAAYERALTHYRVILEDRFDNSHARLQDLEFLKSVIGRYRSLESMLADLTLDPINGRQDTAGAGGEEEDTEPVILSTIHSAKGLEWRRVFLIGLLDGTLPSYRSITAYEDSEGGSAGLEEERRLLYVAVTRAQDELHLTFPLVGGRGGYQGGFMNEVSRFLQPPAVHAALEEVTHVSQEPLTEEDILEAMMGGLEP